MEDETDRRPRCPRCDGQDLTLQVDVQWMFPVDRMEDGVMVLAQGQDIAVYRDPWLRCGDCGHVWRTRRRFEMPPHTVGGW